jgi:hypothetical protein
MERDRGGAFRIQSAECWTPGSPTTSRAAMLSARRSQAPRRRARRSRPASARRPAHCQRADQRGGRDRRHEGDHADLLGRRTSQRKLARTRHRQEPRNSFRLRAWSGRPCGDESGVSSDSGLPSRHARLLPVQTPQRGIERGDTKFGLVLAVVGGATNTARGLRCRTPMTGRSSRAQCVAFGDFSLGMTWACQGS